jgi:hypothetical protein
MDRPRQSACARVLPDQIRSDTLAGVRHTHGHGRRTKVGRLGRLLRAHTHCSSDLSLRGPRWCPDASELRGAEARGVRG